MTITPDTKLPPWMRDILTDDERRNIEEQAQIPLHIPAPMPKEQVVEESDIIEEDGRKHDIVEIDISSPLNPSNTFTL